MVKQVGCADPMVSSAKPLWSREAFALLRTFLRLRDVREVQHFLRDLMTEDEIRMIVHRWWVARLLHAGATYRDIAERTGLSSRTIARISTWLQRGEGGYAALLQRAGKKGRAETQTPAHAHGHHT